MEYSQRTADIILKKSVDQETCESTIAFLFDSTGLGENKKSSKFISDLIKKIGENPGKFDKNAYNTFNRRRREIKLAIFEKLLKTKTPRWGLKFLDV